MILVTEHDTALEIEGKIPPSLIRKLYLMEGASPQLNRASTIFGEPVHFIYLGHNLRTVENFIKQLSGDTNNVFLIAPLSKWSLYLNRLKGIPNLEISNQFETREQKINMARKLIGCSKSKATEILSLFSYNFLRLETNLDVIRWGINNGVDMDELITSLLVFNYTDILYFLTGDERSYKGNFYSALSRYRYAHDHLLKYLRDALGAYIDYKLSGEEPPDKWANIIKRLSTHLFLEQAMMLLQGLKKCRKVEDLLKGGLQ